MASGSSKATSQVSAERAQYFFDIKRLPWTESEAAVTDLRHLALFFKKHILQIREIVDTSAPTGKVTTLWKNILSFYEWANTYPLVAGQLRDACEVYRRKYQEHLADPKKSATQWHTLLYVELKHVQNIQDPHRKVVTINMDLRESPRFIEVKGKQAAFKYPERITVYDALSNDHAAVHKLALSKPIGFQNRLKLDTAEEAAQTSAAKWEEAKKPRNWEQWTKPKKTPSPPPKASPAQSTAGGSITDGQNKKKHRRYPAYPEADADRGASGGSKR